ncbi:hypothetical protein DFH06DRAFT_1300055, partial [Mycena polygramma]
MSSATLLCCRVAGITRKVAVLVLSRSFVPFGPGIKLWDVLNRPVVSPCRSLSRIHHLCCLKCRHCSQSGCGIKAGPCGCAPPSRCVAVSLASLDTLPSSSEASTFRHLPKLGLILKVSLNDQPGCCITRVAGSVTGVTQASGFGILSNWLRIRRCLSSCCILFLSYTLTLHLVVTCLFRNLLALYTS